MPHLEPCWIWRGAKRSRNREYGVFRYKGRDEGAHRIAFLLHHGRWPTPFCLHKCDTPSCVRFDHLFEGTAKDNFHDAMAKGRMIFVNGEDVGTSRLTCAQVQRLSHLYQTSGLSMRTVGWLFGVSRTTVYLIVNNKMWRHLGDQKGTHAEN